MRVVVLCGLLTLGASLSVLDMQSKIDRFMKGLVEGNAQEVVSLVSPDFKHFVNGEEHPGPWTDLNAMTSLFNTVSFGPINPLSSVVISAPNTAMSVFEWELQFKDTLDHLKMGEWQQTNFFNEQGKIVKTHTIADGAHVQMYTDLLVSAQTHGEGEKLYQQHFEEMVKAFNAKNVDGVMNTFIEEEVYWQRNGQNDSFVWPRPKFLAALFQEQVTVKLDSFASAVPRTSYAFLTWTLVKAEQTTKVPDSWFITWTPEGKISHVRSVTNGQEKVIYAYVMGNIAEKLPAEKKEQLRSLYQAQGALSPEDLRKHLDL